MTKRILALALCAIGCAHRGAGKSDGATDSALPDACKANFSGLWEHEGNMTFRYEAQDNGQKLTLIPHRVNADGTPMESDSRAKDMEIGLLRKPEGFVGDFRMMQTTDTGASCGVLFGARITACAVDRLTMEVEQSYAVNEACQRIDMGGSDIAEHVLVRVKDPAPLSPGSAAQVR